MDDIGTLVAKLALKTQQITPAQYAQVSKAYKDNEGRKPYGALLLESGLLSGGALTRILSEHQGRFTMNVESIFTRRIAEQKYASEDTLRECRTAIEDMRSRGFDFDLLELLLKRNAITHDQAAEVRKYFSTQILMCPLCLKTEIQNGTTSPEACPDCKEPYRQGGSDSLMDIATAGEMVADKEKEKKDYPETLGPYKLFREIGRGGMAVVFEGEDRSTGKRVAVKVLRSNVTLDHGYLARFHSEAETLEQLDHPNIVRIQGIGESAGYHYYAMDYVDGQGLDKLVHECKLNLKRTVAWIRDIARALQSAHDRGIVHRDVKPGNIMVDSKGIVFLTDFGLAHRERSNKVTVSGTTVGTPNFMSPEQARGERHRIDHRTDVYSLGTSLYNLGTGRVPYRGNTPEMVIQQILNEEPKRPSLINIDIDPALETIIMRAMEKDPERRFFSAGAMADDLDRWLGGGKVTAVPKTRAERFGDWWTRHGMTVSLAVACVILGFSAAFVILLVHRNKARLAIEERDNKITTLLEEKSRSSHNLQYVQERLLKEAEEARALLETGHRDRIESLLAEHKNQIKAWELKSGVKEDGLILERCERVMAVLRGHRERIDDLVQMGTDIQRSGEYASARVVLGRAREELRRFPGFAASYGQSVQARLHAYPEYVQLIAVDKPLAAVQRRLGEVSSWEVWARWLASQDSVAALVAINRIVADFPGQVEPLILRGMLSMRMGRLAEATADFTDVSALEVEEPRGPLGLAEVKMLQGNLADARLQLEKVPAGRVRHPDFYIIEGACLMGLGRYEQGLRTLEVPADLRSLPDILCIRGKCHLGLKQYAQAAEHAQAAAKAIHDAERAGDRTGRLLTGRSWIIFDIWATAAEAQLELGDKKAAREAAEKALKVRPEDAGMLKALQKSAE